MLKKPLNRPETISFGPFLLDLSESRLSRRGVPVDLPRRSLCVLCRLLEEPGRTVSRTRLLDSVWVDVHVSPTSLAEAVSRLRAALDDDPAAPRYVETVRGEGYRFVGQVTRPSRLPTRKWYAAAAAALGVALLGWAFLRPVAPGGATITRLTADGAIEGTLPLPSLEIEDLAVAPDGRRVALSVTSESGEDIWLFDPDREALTRLTTGGRNVEMVWSPDGAWIAYASDREGDFDILRRRADSSGVVETMLRAPGDQFPESWSSDGLGLVYSHTTPGAGLDLALLGRDESAPVGWVSRPLRSTRAHEYLAALSPARDAMVFVSDRSGSWEAYVQGPDEALDPVRISRGGVRDVFWGVDGRSVIYLERNRLVRVPLTADGRPELAARTSTEIPKGSRRLAPIPDGGFVAAVF